MANLILVIDDDVLLRARKRALDHGTSVNALLQAGFGRVSRRVLVNR